MFSYPSSKPSPKARIVEIDAQLGNIPPFECILRQSPREEKNKLLCEVKGKSSTLPPLYPHAQHIIYTLGYYTPAELYKTHPESHKDRQQFRRDKEALLHMQLKEKQQVMKKLAVEITKIKRLIEISIKERAHSYEEELEKVYSEALRDPGENEEEDEQPEGQGTEHRTTRIFIFG